MVKVTFNAPDGSMTTVEVENGTSVMEAAVNNGVPGIDADCGGACSCATCHVHIDPSSAVLAQIEEDEEFLLEDAEGYDKAQSRLSCQVILNDSHAGMHVQLLESD